jgi:hypothetical protein
VRHARGLLFLAFATVFLAGCGGGGSDGAAATATATGAASTTAAETAPVTKDEAEALSKSMLLRLSDFPPGWRAEPSDDQGSCAGIDRLTDRYDVLTKADSDDFAQGDSTQVASSAGLFNDEATARDGLNYLEASIQSKRFRDCLNGYFRKQADEDVTFGDVHVGQVSFPTLADRSSAWEVVVPVKTQGLTISVYIEAIFMRRANALGIVLFSDVISPFDEQMRERLARLVARRMDEAVAEIP